MISPCSASPVYY